MPRHSFVRLLRRHTCRWYDIAEETMVSIVRRVAMRRPQVRWREVAGNGATVSVSVVQERRAVNGMYRPVLQHYANAGWHVYTVAVTCRRGEPRAP